MKLTRLSVQSVEPQTAVVKFGDLSSRSIMHFAHHGKDERYRKGK
jgi:hypothetical protein